MAGAGLSARLERRFGRGPTIEATFELDLAAGHTLGLLGPSGAGKTTILRCLAGLERPDRGSIVADGQVWFDAERGVNLPPQRRRIGYLPQGYALFPHLSVADNVGFGIDGLAGRPKHARIAELIELVGLDGFERRRPRELSGGQQQRVALARALARRPQLLLLDEPLSALDTVAREELRGDLRRLLVRLRLPAIVVSHDRTEVLVLADRVALVDAGRLIQEGPTGDVFARPASTAAARIVGADTVAVGSVVESDAGLATIEVSGHRLTAPSALPVGTPVVVTVRPEDVVLMAPGGSSAGLSTRNRIEGVVAGVEPLGPIVRVRLDCGFELRALITRPAFDELAAQPGDRLLALVKATSLHLIPAGEG